MRLRYTQSALNDLSSILDYLADRSTTGAKRVHSRIRLIIELLPNHPHICAPTEDTAIRRLTALPYPYLVFYEVGDTRDPAFIAWRAG